MSDNGEMSTELARTTSTELAVINMPTGTGDQLEFREDTAVLVILRNKVFRQAISLDAELLLMPDIEKEALTTVPDLSESLFHLDQARDGLTNLHDALAKWKEELGLNGQTPQDR